MRREHGLRPQERQRLTQMLEQGLPLLREFGEKTDALARRGFEAYSPRRSLRYRVKEWRFNRSVAAAESFTVPPPAWPLDPGLPPESDAPGTE